MIFLAAALVIALAAAVYRHYFPLPPKLTLRASRFDWLDGWSEDHVAAAIPAFLKSCGAITVRGEGEPFDPVAKSSDFGAVGDWRPLCDEAAMLPHDDTVAATFFEKNFTPLLAGNNGNDAGLFTGYFEILLNGARHREGPYQTPIYRPPPDPKTYTRAQIEDGALAGKGLELLWVDDPVGAYLLQVQGSGVVHLTDGKSVRLGYDGGNGQKFVSIGRLLVERNEISLKDMTMQTLRDWIVSHGAAGKALIREDPSFVFFKETPGDGPRGSERVVLTAQRSLAVDRRFIPLGMPLWLEASQRFSSGVIHRLVIAQDTGGAIKGPVRGDLYWGGGDAAAREAGAMNATGHYSLLVPNALAVRALAAARD